MKTTRWLAAVAGVALLAGVPTVAADAATRAKTGVRVKAKKRKVVVRRARPARRAAVVVVPVAPPPAYVGPPAPAYQPAPRFADYRWLDDADAMAGAIGQSRPDVVFAVDRDARYAWILGDGALVIAEPLGTFDQRWYFFEPDVTVPFLVRDVGRSFAFERGRLVALYDREGTLDDWRPGDEVEAQAAALADHGRELWFAARTPRPLPPREQTGSFWGQFAFGGDLGWRDNGGRRAYRDRNRDVGRDDRYAREREARQARGDRWHPAASMGNGYWTSGSSRPSGANGPGGGRPPATRAPVPDRPRVIDPPRAGYQTPGSAEAPMPSVPRGSTEGYERRATEPAAERPGRRMRPVDEPTAAVMPTREEAAPAPAPAVERAPRYRPEPEATPRREPAAAPAPEPAPAPVVAPRSAPEAPARVREPEPAPPPRAAPPPEPTPAPAPPERPKEHQREDERPE